MSLETAAETLANHLASLEYVEMYSHYDADGIAAAAIMSLALSRADIAFKLRILPGISEADVENPEISLLCDFGASCTGLAESTMILDHHVPYNTSPYHVNPRLFGEDGETELSGAGCAYLVANALGDNRNLAGLVMLGIIGDNQTLSGRNQTIIGDAVANNLVNPGRGVLLAGRTTKEQIANSLHPYLPSLSGDEEKAAAIESACMSKVSDDAYTSCMLSQIVLDSDASYNALMNLYGDSWSLEREVIPNAHTFTAVVDACGKAGKSGIAYALCCGDASYLDEAWKIAVSYRNRVIAAVRTAEKIRDVPAVWRVGDCAAASDAADVLAESASGPMFVLGRDAASLRVSARAPRGSSVNLEQILRTTAQACGGSGGGHQLRAGADVPLDREDEFLAGLEAAACT
ncbi:DHHA1 domain-containing protein [Methanocorpusculum vombati]|uniref:DHHA1 domain-containing protein n=1 Tax=Methanocorpusculum vombati TaxID=3002864 RepID=A0ABT4IP32_9EURY|nr:DHHA1 domain-containing protein [Methanocorpusculum vombati]MCZ9320443.1 DHHA1 domain-containing protein [Methanocorpusculum sp.]MCZ0863518.1 DHHA1 domain-containing protein [Methanocorpusculum vombati]MDE2519902.1 DHHA1 domain-containing protein [Methanocorpusculum sp.]MDE2534385.1 DHHA1 domain-containing protein [Methanocorpusculum sp.]MDE2545287.1 DHHA1 domain-containing protein [Methanocorpusculum sp.]